MTTSHCLRIGHAVHHCVLLLWDVIVLLELTILRLICWMTPPGGVQAYQLPQNNMGCCPDMQRFSRIQGYLKPELLTLNLVFKHLLPCIVVNSFAERNCPPDTCSTNFFSTLCDKYFSETLDGFPNGLPDELFVFTM